MHNPQRKPLAEAARERPLLGDGAMGTQLMLAGLERGACGEEWNLTHPERVLAIQRAYVEAGSECLITNTFGGSRIALGRHGLAGRTARINRASVAIAREAFDGRNGYVLGDIGPFGGLLEPFGEYRAADVRAAFDEQARALVEAGADAIIVETQTALEELLLGIQAAREAGAGCIIASMAFDVKRGGASIRTMMGVDPEGAARSMEENGVQILGFNCGAGMDMAVARKVVERYRSVSRLPIMAQPNAGRPELADGVLAYRETPEQMALGVPGLVEAGANIIGACCGSTPAHIAAFRAALSARNS